MSNRPVWVGGVERIRDVGRVAPQRGESFENLRRGQWFERSPVRTVRWAHRDCVAIADNLDLERHAHTMPVGERRSAVMGRTISASFDVRAASSVFWVGTSFIPVASMRAYVCR